MNYNNTKKYTTRTTSVTVKSPLQQQVSFADIVACPSWLECDSKRFTNTSESAKILTFNRCPTPSSKRAFKFQDEKRVPGEIKRSSDRRGGRWSWTLKFALKRSWVGRWSWAKQAGHLLLRVVQVVRQQQCNGHCLSDSVQHSSWNSNCAVHKSLGNGEGTPP